MDNEENKAAKNCVTSVSLQIWHKGSRQFQPIRDGPFDIWGEGWANTKKNSSTAFTLKNHAQENPKEKKGTSLKKICHATSKEK